jgi:hypothetical protein
LPTRYILAFEPGFSQHQGNPRPETGHGRDEQDDLPFAPTENTAEINATAPDEGDNEHSLTENDLTEGLNLGFDGAEDVLRAWRRGMRPDADLTVSEWADAHRWLSSRAAAEPGRYRTARAPYLREIMDALSPSHPAQRISFMKAAQVGATEAGNNWIGFVIHHAPGPMLAVLPTVEMAKRTSRGRIDPLIEDSPALKERVQPARSRDAGNSMLSKEFPGGILVLTGANSATGLRSMPARYVFLDEVDAYPASADEEGDPVTLAEARTTTFAHRRKVFMVSTPTIRGLSRIEREFEASDQRRYSGTRSVSYDGKTVNYGTDAELAAAIGDVERRIAKLERGAGGRADGATAASDAAFGNAAAP